MNPLRSVLFVPADRGERIPKALASGADAVIADLEDAVVPSAKDGARNGLLGFLDAHPDTRLLVRVNAADTDYHEDDLRACAHPGVTAVVLPKATDPAEVSHAAAVSGKPVWPIVESTQGLLSLAALASAPGCERLILGTIDLGLDLGLQAGTPRAEAMLDQARFAVLVHARAQGLPPPIDGVHPAVSDTAGLARAAAHARAVGFGAMLCIHPSQVAGVNRAFTPTVEELAWAHKVVEAARNAPGAFALDGQMVDAPVLERARRLLRSAPADRA